MNSFKDENLHDSFLELGKFILNILDSKTDSNVKKLFSELSEQGISVVFKKHLQDIFNSVQFENFKTLLINNDIYKKNFEIPVGTNATLHNIKVDFFVEHIFLDYIKKNGIVWGQHLVEQYYDNIEKFLIDDQIIVTVTTPVYGLKVTNNNFQIDDGISINLLQKQRKFRNLLGVNSLKYAVAHYDLTIKFPTKKIYKDVSEEEKRNSIDKKSRIIIQNIMMILRLYRAGRIGFIDSELALSIPVGTIGWLNPRCGLPEYWETWIQPSYTLAESDIEEISKLRTEIAQLINKEKAGFLFRAIDRFMISYEEDRIEDRILDLVISLESLLQPEIDELRYKLSVRTAKFLGNTSEGRNRIYKTIYTAYKIRSETAHGVTNPAELQNVIIGTEEITLETLAERVEEYLRNAIKQMIKLLNEGKNRDTIIKKLDDELFLEANS